MSAYDILRASGAVMGNQRQIFLALCALALMAEPTIAADLPLGPAPYFAVPPLVRSYYTGCYVGGQLGWAFEDNQFSGQFVDTAVPPSLAVPNTPTTAVISSSNPIAFKPGGSVAGGQVGCDYQFGRHWVIGAEVGASWANISGNTAQNQSLLLAGTVPVPGAPPGTTVPIFSTLDSTGLLASKTNFIATATGRFGYAIDELLFYAKGGVAWARNEYNFDGQVGTSSCGFVFVPPLTIPPLPPFCGIQNATVNTPFNFNASETRVGWTVGLGMEYVVPSSNWSIKFEWDYLGLGTQTVTFTDPVMGSNKFSVSQNINLLKFGFNYRFLHE